METQELILACQENDLKKVENILDSDQQSSVSVVDETGKAAIHHCAERGDIDLFKKIFDSDASMMDKRDDDGYTPLTFAVIGGNGPVVEFLLDKGADVNNLDAEKHSLIHWATVCGRADILTKLLKKGALPYTPDLHGAHALHYATQFASSTNNNNTEDLEILNILLKFGANVNCTDFDERTPLLWAASCGNCVAISALLETGADKHACDKDRLTALHCAASRGHGDVIRLICKSASDVQINARDKNGSTPLFYAVALGHADAAKALLEHQAVVDLQDKKLRTAAHCAAARGQLSTLKLLHQHGASFALENYRGDLPIHEAVQAGSLEVIAWMLSISPTYVNATNHDGRTSLHLAAALGHLDACKLLIAKGANKDALMLSKNDCVTSLDLAEEKDHQEVVNYLRSIGAQRCNELTPQSIIDEFKKHMAVRKLTTKGTKKKSTADMDAQTSRAEGTEQAVQTMHKLSSEEMSKIVKKGRKKKKGRHEIGENGEMEKCKRKGKHKNKQTQDENEDGLDSSRTSANVSDITANADDHKQHIEKENQPAPIDENEEYSQDFSVDTPEQKNQSQSNSESPSEHNQQIRFHDIDTESALSNSRTIELYKKPKTPLDRFRLDWESSLRSRVQRYAEEKRIFQELANLKRLQIQYGNVREEIIVRRLIDDFLKRYNGIQAGDFQMDTFNAWEKFLYDQLKILYRKEKESLMQSYESKVKSQSSLFEQKQNSATGRLRVDDHIDRLSRTYGIAPIPMQYSPRLYKASFMNRI